MLRNVRGTSHSITRGSILSLGLILVQFLSAAAVLAIDIAGNQGEIDTVTLFLDPDPYDRFPEFAEILSPDHLQESVTLQPTFQWACTGVCPTRRWDVRIVREDGTWLDRRVPRVSFRVDLDLLAPLGAGTQNAAKWFAAFTVPDGPRLAEWETAREYRQPKTGERGVFFMPDAPLLLEAERWVDQALMRFHPDVWDSPEANRQGTLNYLMTYDLAGAWVGRGDSRKTPMGGVLR